MEVKNLKNYIEYQNNSIVSREIIKNEKGTLTVFAFDKDQGLSEHTAPFDAFVYIIEGKAEIKISDKFFTLSEGNSIIMPANIPHTLKAEEKFKMLLFMVKN